MIDGRLFAAVAAATLAGASLALLPRLALSPQATTRIDRTAFMEATLKGERAWADGKRDGVPRIAPPPGSDIYLMANRYDWRPALKLTAGGTYRLHLSSADVLHGLLAPSLGWRFEAAPGYERVVTVTAPDVPGTHLLLCDEFCGDGHHLMTSRIEVVPSPQP
ncbi:MAG: hypothetical protein HQK87_09705 [Nitrospinae bacterium]|nr:hypothetical protein [Nitrospinota bacterium]